MRAVGIILAGGNSHAAGVLSQKRAIAALPIAGSYRAIDFSLSNMTNSQIKKVAVLTQYNARSLYTHLNSSKWWDFGRKQGGLYLFTPTINNEHSWWYRGTADSLLQNLDFLRKSHEPYVIIASGDGIYKLDYNEVLEYHIGKRADITIVCKDLGKHADVCRFGVVNLDHDNRVLNLEEKPMVPTNSIVSTGIYVIRRRLLIELLEKCEKENRYDFVNDILIRYKNLKRIYAYLMTSYWNNVSTVDSYYKVNMDFLKPEIRRFFFRDAPEIHSKIEDHAPAKYNDNAWVRNSLVSSGCIINGAVEDSVLLKKAYIGNGTVIKNSVILNNVYIGDNCYIENCIVESNGTIRSGSRFVGEEAVQVVVERNDRFAI
ncbi:MAG: glucose-1-phosphate adenylyltransferase subunit GlgD [Lachnospiraceae bacterium]|nr:glucose-1-phosphate adenylyltransferase subunit GlgD [Lachnospiraceae bacterium]MDY5742045.1 glucose-1-phosphate adenylyltransferase subunit GlgD [Lachnospiraceae bacterium]